MDHASSARAAGSRDSVLTLRRVERQQQLIELLSIARERVTLARLAGRFGVSERTIARDLERLRLSGVPIEVIAGRGGGARLRATGPAPSIVFDLPELAALVSSLAALGPTATESADSAMRKLVSALAGDPTTPTHGDPERRRTGASGVSVSTPKLSPP